VEGGGASVGRLRADGASGWRWRKCRAAGAGVTADADGNGAAAVAGEFSSLDEDGDDSSTALTAGGAG
jgi:hypothetical protein